jgi:dolichol-phosphate mannosyltransferase
MQSSYEVLLVDDGSTDESVDYLVGLEWPECRLVRLASNRGHQEALDAGLRLSRGEWTITMDSDLQHPPSAIPSMLSLAQDLNVDVVYAVRTERAEESLFKRTTARAYYRLMRGLTGVPIKQGAADFRLLSRSVVATVNALPEEKVFRLLLPYLGFSHATFAYQADPRVAGSSKYSLSRMGRLTISSVVQFSTRPLQASIALGLVSSLLALVWLVAAVVAWVRGAAVEGWTSLAVMVLFLGGVQLLSIGILGMYVGRLYDFVRLRPRHKVLSVTSLDRQA